MKKLLVIVSMVFVSLNCMIVHAKDRFVSYYYDNCKIDLVVNQKYVLVYFDLNKTAISEIKNEYDIYLTVELTKSERGKFAAYVIGLDDCNYDSTIAAIKSRNDVFDIEPVVGSYANVMVSNKCYVKLKSKMDVKLLSHYASEYKFQINGEISNDQLWYELEVDKHSDADAIEMSNILWETGTFANIDPGFIIKPELYSTCPSVQYFNRQWGMRRIHACDAWDITTGSSDIVVAIIDNGVDVTHSEFNNTSVVYSYDMTTETVPATVGVSSHGTHIGGIVFADHNSGKVAGMSPRSSLINISDLIQIDYSNRTVTENFLGRMKDAINLAVNNGADVINCSWGFGDYDENIGYLGHIHYDQGHPMWYVNSALLNEAIENALIYGRNGKGCVVVCAAGNKRIEENTQIVAYPANSHPGILTVGAIDSNDLKTWYSNYGYALDVVAPGEYILSTINNEEYAFFGGTSMAAPHAAGLAALILSENPNLTGEQVCRIIQTTAEKLTTYQFNNTQSHPDGTWNDSVGYGLINAAWAVSKADSVSSIDLYIRDDGDDSGYEPNVGSNIVSQSPDIKITDLNDDPVDFLDAGQSYYAHVTVHNRSGQYLLTSKTLRLYWSLVGTNLRWKDSFLNYDALCDAFFGAPLAVQSVSNIAPGSSYTYIIPFTAPTFSSSSCAMVANNKVRFAIVAVMDDGTITSGINANNLNLENFVRQNNNVAWKNMSWMTVSNDNMGVVVGNPNNHASLVNIGYYAIPNASTGNCVNDAGDVYIKFPKELYTRWQNMGSKGFGFTEVDYNGLFLATGHTVRFDSVPFNREETAAISVMVDHPATNNVIEYEFDLYQHCTDCNSETEFTYGRTRCYYTTDKSRNLNAVAHDSRTVLAGSQVTLTADDVDEEVEYRWYNQSGDTLAVSQSVTVTPTATQQYRLEVKAQSDGVKDFDTVIITVVQGMIVSLTPNPATDEIAVVSGLTVDVANAVLVVTNATGSTVMTVPVGSTNTTTLNLQGLPSGLYYIQLIAANRIYDTKTFVKQ